MHLPPRRREQQNRKREQEETENSPPPWGGVGQRSGEGVGGRQRVYRHGAESNKIGSGSKKRQKTPLLPEEGSHSEAARWWEVANASTAEAQRATKSEAGARRDRTLPPPCG